MEIFQPVMESAMVLAAHYAQACGRDVVLVEDVRYGLMFAARNVTGRHLGTLYPEAYQSESEEEGDPDYDEESATDSEGSWETVSDSEMVWTRYEGNEDKEAQAMNECADTWDAWEPETPAEQALKNAVQNVGQR